MTIQQDITSCQRREGIRGLTRGSECSYEMENPKNRLNNWRNRCRWMDEQKERRGNSRGGAERRLNM